MEGKLVGINTAIFSRSGGSNGIGFAIPSHMARFVATAAGQGDMVRRPWLGATVQTVSAEISEALGLDRPRGVLITNVFEKSPAARAGLRVGDLVISVDGKEVIDPDSFGYRFATRQLGEKSSFTVLRSGGEAVVEIELESAPETVPRDERLLEELSPFEGATVMNLSPAVAEELRLDGEFEGVVITAIDPRGAAARVGLRIGDIVHAVNGTKIDSTRKLERETRRGARVWDLEIERGNQIQRIRLRG